MTHFCVPDTLCHSVLHCCCCLCCCHRTDHDCNKHPYNNRHHSSWVGPNLQKNKVAGREWETTIFKELICDQATDTCYSFYVPIDEPDGSYSQVGVVYGRCALNGNAEQCNDALCNQMALTVQGGRDWVFISYWAVVYAQYGCVASYPRLTGAQNWVHRYLSGQLCWVCAAQAKCNQDACWPHVDGSVVCTTSPGH
jgi:hypothetical protein